MSKWPQMEGRFPQVGRITFNFDGKAEPGQRIHDDSIQIGGVPVEKGKVNFCDSLFDNLEYLKVTYSCCGVKSRIIRVDVMECKWNVYIRILL